MILRNYQHPFRCSDERVGSAIPAFSLDYRTLPAPSTDNLLINFCWLLPATFPIMLPTAYPKALRRALSIALSIALSAERPNALAVPCSADVLTLFSFLFFRPFFFSSFFFRICGIGRIIQNSGDYLRCTGRALNTTEVL